MSNGQTLKDSDFLKGRTALITGGFSGIGLAAADKLACCGASVAVGSRNNSRSHAEIDTVLENLARSGQNIFHDRLDVCDVKSVETFVSKAQAALGHIDILVNAAGITVEQGVAGHRDDLWQQIIDTNLTGAFRATRAVLPQMMERGWGRIINIGSTAATAAWKDNPAYCASKAGLLGLTRCVALEGAPHGVSCVMVSPTWVETDLMRKNIAEIAEREGRGRTGEDIVDEIVADNPQHRLIQPDEVAATVVFLCRDEAFGLSMGNIQVTGGALW